LNLEPLQSNEKSNHSRTATKNQGKWQIDKKSDVETTATTGTAKTKPSPLMKKLERHSRGGRGACVCV
jgi:hypothetical protein